MCVIKAIDMSKLDCKRQHDAVNEVKLLASLKHQYIVRYHESFIENEVLAIVMDFAAGGDLRKRIQHARSERRPFAEPQILTWFTQVVLGLRYLHGRQVIHRDLKGANLFLTDQDQLRIGDFGLSRMLTQKAVRSSRAVGTPHYLSPEICIATVYSCASDIWALGVCLYELAVLRVPFDAPNFPELVEKITLGHTPAIPCTYSIDLRTLGQDLLCKNVKTRPSSSDIIKRPIIQKEISHMFNAKIDSTPSRSPAMSSARSSSCPSKNNIAFGRACVNPSRKTSLTRMQLEQQASDSRVRPSSSVGKASVGSMRPRIRGQADLHRILTPLSAADTTLRSSSRDGALRVGVSQRSPSSGSHLPSGARANIASAKFAEEFVVSGCQVGMRPRPQSASSIGLHSRRNVSGPLRP